MIKHNLHYLVMAALFALVAGCRTGPPAELQSATLVVTNGTVIDGTGSEPISNGLVAIEGNRIIAVGIAADFNIPEDVPIIDAAGGTILPGIFNAHVHNVSSAAPRRIYFLLDGVTSVCDMATSLPSMIDFEQEGMQAGPAARGYKAGPILAAPGGYPGSFFGIQLAYEIQGEDQAASAVQDLQSRGADYIKTALESGLAAGKSLPLLNPEEMGAIVTSAHNLNLLVRAHVIDHTLLDIALNAGVDVIEHVPMPPELEKNLDTMIDESGNFQIPPDLSAQLLQMVEQGIVLVPTLDVFIIEADQHTESEFRKTEEFFEAITGIIRFFHDSGGVLAVGNDYGVYGVDPGMPLQEMEYLQSAGLSPMEVIEAATRHAAFVCGQGNDLGTLEKGKLADLIVVNGNPLDDLRVLDSVIYVVKDGKISVFP